VDPADCGRSFGITGGCVCTLLLLVRAIGKRREENSDFAVVIFGVVFTFLKCGC